MLTQAARSARLLRAPLGWWRGRGAFVQDAVLAAALALLALVPTLSAIGPQLGDLPERRQDAAGVALALAQSLPLMFRRRRPGACLAVIGAAFAAHQALGCPQTFGGIGLYLALYAAGAHRARHRQGLAVAASAGYAVLAAVLHHRGSPQQVPDYLAFYAVLAVAWLAGAAVRRWRAEEAERRLLAAELAIGAERARLARELHDVVTHHVTAMVVQADAAQFLLGTAPDRAGESLTAISGTGRRALTELRSLLGVLEATSAAAPAGDAQGAGRGPALGKVSDLVGQARLSGQPVEWREEGAPRPRPVDVELAAYRVVQEALTNAMKYATGRPTAVEVRHGDERLEIEVTTEGPGRDAHLPKPRKPLPAGGRGLNGLRERVRMLDGELIAGARPDGGFSVRAVIPCRPGPADPGECP
ncbi:sensor histidine kinase [Streptomyces hoynatensis]|uniref:histidine kinase n=1 Tax=Streptomyces hoynatensis TaxID=1141874 RepID=A0A3A9Z0C4_9ACTN|nr:histidine kinase [Streptomyces hoynatensis]RKN41665.1 two-component sensor histidine kinase [Streptomyces hoynatensis]